MPPVALTYRYQEALARIRANTALMVAAAWDGLPGYDQRDVAAFVDASTPLAAAGQHQAAVLTDGYLAARLRRTPVGVDLETVTGAAVRAGTPPDDVYRRAFVTTWTSLKDGNTWRDAVAAGRARAMSAAETDVALATRAAAAQIGEADDRIVGWERVPDGGACEFCLLAATQRYHSGDLMPLHNRCGCTVEPITGDTDPGHVLHKDQLAALKVGDVNEARRLAGERLAVHEHGELGPILGDRDHAFVGPDEII